MSWWKVSTKVSDWCTLWPDRWRNYDYSACCQQHDDEYEDPSISRWRADVGLFQCVRKNCGVLMAGCMFTGVRCFGWMFKHYRRMQ